MWRWLWAVLAIAAAKIVIGVLGYSASLLGATILEPGIMFPEFQAATVLAYSLVAVILLYAGFNDKRAVHLGGAFLLIASSSTDSLFVGLSLNETQILSSAIKLLFRLQPDAFLPVFLWLFFAEFPLRSGFGLASTLPNKAARFCSFVGAAFFFLFVFEMNIFFPGQPEGVASLPVHNMNLHVIAWAVSLSLSLPALALAVWNIRGAPIGERRRVRLFLTGLGLGLIPTLVAMVLEATVPAFARIVKDPSGRTVESMILRPLLILVPAITAYSVLVDRILDIKLYLRRAVQYALTRYALLAAAVVPLFLFIAYIYSNRAKSIAELLTDSHLVLPMIAAFSMLGLLFRSKANRLVDRYFFREQYDAKYILSEFVNKSRDIESAAEMASMLGIEINRALHLETASVLFKAGETGELICYDGTVQPFQLSWPLAKLLAGSPDPLDIDLTSKEGTLHRLSAEEREWLAEGGVNLLVPLLASDKSLVGLIALGEKKSELPFSSEDRMLLAAIAAAVALTLENRVLRSTSDAGLKEAGTAAPEERKVSSSPALHNAAVECVSCHRILPQYDRICSDCGGSITAAKVPLILRGKFRFEKRLALGGMAAVYEATDMDLQRQVAIKTLPRTSPELSSRLRREARAVAAVSHPNLAPIFGVEMWQGTPMLVFEYLEGGTLAQRIKKGRLEIEEGLKLGILLCSALDRLHSSGILHRDIKPSNIGYTSDGIPKILDLGLAKIEGRIEGEQAVPQSDRDISNMLTPSLTLNPSLTMPGVILGTLAYLPPEAFRAAPANPRFDLWSLSVVLLESLTAVNPFVAETGPKTVERILHVSVASLNKFTQGLPEIVAALFADLLVPEAGSRPASAMELSSRLKETLVRISPRVPKRGE
jgi:hypothetical protein